MNGYKLQNDLHLQSIVKNVGVLATLDELLRNYAIDSDHPWADYHASNSRGVGNQICAARDQSYTRFNVLLVLQLVPGASKQAIVHQVEVEFK